MSATALLFDVSHRGKIELTGPEAATFLHNLCTNDIVRLKPQSGCEAFFTNLKAKIVARAFIYRVRTSDTDESFWLDTDSGVAERLVQHLDRHRISEQVEFSDRTQEFGQFHLAGNQAGELLAAVFSGVFTSLEQLESVLVPPQP